MKLFRLGLGTCNILSAISNRFSTVVSSYLFFYPMLFINKSSKAHKFCHLRHLVVWTNLWSSLKIESRPGPRNGNLIEIIFDFDSVSFKLKGESIEANRKTNILYESRAAKYQKQEQENEEEEIGRNKNKRRNKVTTAINVNQSDLFLYLFFVLCMRYSFDG